MNSSKVRKNGGKLEDLYTRIIDGDMARKLKIELLIVARKGNEATRKAIREFMDYLERHPDVRAWLKSGAIVGIILEVVPLSGLGIWMAPGFVPGAVTGCIKGSKTGTTLRSTVVGGLVSWPLKPVISLSPIVGMLLVGFAAGTLEEMLAGAAKEAMPAAAGG